MIELKGVTKQYLYGARVLGALDLAVSDGEIIAVLGGEGSGKTTLLKVIAGATECEGQVLIDGGPLAKKPDGVAMIFDDLALFQNRSCFFNLAYPLKIRGESKEKISSTVYDAASRLKITACLDERVKKMSVIDKRRLAVARLFLRDVRVVLVDDITRGLCANEAEELWQELEPLLIELAKTGACVIYATSRLDEAISIADRVAIMSGGEMKQLDAPKNICENPSSVWAAQAMDGDFAFERVTLKEWDGSLQAVFEDKYGVNIDCLKDRIAKEYVGKATLAGWRSDSYDLSGERREQVDYAVRVKGGFLLHTKNSEKKRVVFSEKKLDEVGTLPKSDKLFLFDATNENSILF